MREAIAPVFPVLDAPMSRPVEVCPWPGARPFGAGEAAWFFGRDTVVSGMVQVLLTQRVLALIGPAASGRTSLVRAGLIPALHTGWLRPDDEWRVAYYTPGVDPIRELARALIAPDALGPELDGEADARNLAPEAALPLVEAELRQGPLGLAELVRDAQRARPEDRPFQFLLVVDAFDALLPAAHGRSSIDDDREAVINLILAARGRLDATGIHVVLVVNADRMGECALVPDLPEMIAGAQVIVPPCDVDQLALAASAPATTVGGSVDPRAAQELARQLVGEPEALVLVQSVMVGLWATACARSPSSPNVTVADVAALGNVREIVRTRAEAALAGLDSTMATLAERLLCATISVHGAGDGATFVSHPVKLASAAEFCGLPTERWRDLAPLIEALGDSGGGLLQLDGPIAPDVMVRFVRPKLIEHWPRLREMLLTDVERARQYRRLRDRILGQSDKPLSRAELSMALEWRDGVPPPDFSASEGDVQAQTLPPVWQPTAGWAVRHAGAANDGSAIHDFERVMGIIGKTESRVRRREQAEEERRQNALKTLMRLRATDKRTADQQIAGERAAAEAARQEERRLAAYAMSIQSALESAESAARSSRRRARVATVFAVLFAICVGVMSWVLTDLDGSARVARSLGVPSNWLPRTAHDPAGTTGQRRPAVPATTTNSPVLPSPSAVFADDRPR